ncbi:MAG: aspartyl protease family protein [Candidatus Aquilonibacter sp.]
MFAALLLAATIEGDDAFKGGDFAAAQSAYIAAIRANPRDATAALGLTRLAIYQNDLRDAQHWLDVLAELAPSDPRIAGNRATIAARTDASIDRVAPHNGPAVIAFLQTDPLPMVDVRVNGHDAHFLIDTGAPNIVLDARFAQSLGLTISAAGQGTFAGGERAAMSKAMVDQLDLGGWQIDNVPATVLPLPRDFPADGILGTALFAHFLTTLDYRNGRLVLEDRIASDAFERDAAARGDAIVPLWLVSDHFMFVQGHAGSGPVGLFNVDTGGTFGLQLTKAGLEAAKTSVDAAHPQTGVGGAGAVTTLPFKASLTIGTYTVDNLDGVYFPSGDQYGSFPFTITGTVSHEFFRHTAVTFDFAAMRMVIEK